MEFIKRHLRSKNKNNEILILIVNIGNIYIIIESLFFPKWYWTKNNIILSINLNDIFN